MASNASIVLKTAAPSTPQLSYTDGNVLTSSTDFDAIGMTIALGSVSDLAVTEMLLYGYKGTVVKTFTGDGNETNFEYESDSSLIAEYSHTKVNGTTSSDASDATASGTVTFNTAPAEGDVIEVYYVKKTIAITDAQWEPFAVTKTIALDQTLVETAGSATVYLKVRDDVRNESLAASATATVDTSAPSANISSIVMGDGTYSTTPTNKISEVAGRDTITLTYQATETIQAWKALVVESASDAHNASTNIVIPQTYGSVTSASNVSIEPATNVNCVIKGRDLKTAVNSDGTYIVKIFVQDTAGNWSA